MLKKKIFDRHFEEIFLLLKHLQGRHNQHTHGNRWTTSPSGNRELLRRGGEKPVSSGRVSTASVLHNGIQNGQKIANDFLDKAKIQTFEGEKSLNATFKFSVEGKNFFAKTVNPQEIPGFGGPEFFTNNELRGPAILNAMGMEKYSIPVATTEHDGKTYLIQPWQENASSGLAQQEHIKNLSDTEVTKLLLAEYLTGAKDRHGGNIMIVNGQVKELDFGFSQQKDDKLPSDSFIYTETQAKFRPIDTDVIQRTIQNKTAILKAAMAYESPNLEKTLEKRFSNMQLALSYGAKNWHQFDAYMYMDEEE